MNTVEVKTSELVGFALNWAVAKCQKRHAELAPNKLLYFGGSFDGNIELCEYSINWSQAGPIIERESISHFRLEDEYGVDSKGFTTSKRIPVYGAIIGDIAEHNTLRNSYGEDHGDIYYVPFDIVVKGTTALIAAMRCYVASKLGDTVQIPAELIKK